MLKLLLITIPLIALIFAGLAITILLKKDGEFPQTRVGHNKNLRKKKIYCYNTQQKIIDKNIKSSRKSGNISCGSC